MISECITLHDRSFCIDRMTAGFLYRAQSHPKMDMRSLEDFNVCVTRATYRSLTQTVRVWISIFALASCREPCTQGNGAKALSQSAFQIRVEKISVFQSSH